MRNDDIPAVRVFGCKFVETVTSHVHHHVALSFDNVISTADHLVRIMRTDIVARIHEPGPTGPEKSDTLLQAANPVRIVTIPSYHLFEPLEVDDVIRCIRVPKLIRGTSYVNPRRPDSIA